MATLEDNSYASRRERERPPHSEIKGRMIPKEKKPFARRILDMFLSDKIDDVGDYITYNVIGPGIKTLLFDVVSGAVSMIFWGDPNVRRRNSPGTGGNNNRKAYDRMYDDRRSDQERYQRPAYDVPCFMFDSERDAMDKLDELYWYLDRYNVVKVSDFYTVMDASPDGNFQVNSYGWKSLRDVDIYQTSEGWVLSMPRAVSIR